MVGRLDSIVLHCLPGPEALEKCRQLTHHSGAYVHPKSLQLYLFATPWTVARQAPLSMGFSRQESWSGLPCPPAGDLPYLEIEPTSLTSPALAGGFFATSATWEALITVVPV